MKKIILISLLIFNSLVALSRIETVDLVYDKNEVYRGNTFKVKLRVKSHKGKVYYSDVYNRYNCENFKFKFSSNCEIVKETNEYLLIKVIGPISDKVITADLKYVFNGLNKYSFNIHIHNFIKELKKVRLNLNSTGVLSNSDITFTLTGMIENTDLINFQHTGKLLYEDIDVTVLSGGELLDSNKIRIFDLTKNNRELVVKIDCISNPYIQKVFRYDIICNPVIIMDFKVKNGANGLNGLRGQYKKSNYGTVSNGTNGTNGMVGKEGLSKMIKIDLIYDNRFIDSVLKVDFYEVDNRTISNSSFLQKGEQILIIKMSGGDGGFGGNGGSGGNGALGMDGGNGGDGSNGGDGGDGGNMIVKYTKEAEKYKNSIIVKTYGGRGGFPGRGGIGGKPGSSYANSSGDLKGRTGHGGRDGRAGRDGRDGTVRYVLIE